MIVKVKKESTQEMTKFNEFNCIYKLNQLKMQEISMIIGMNLESIYPNSTKALVVDFKYVYK